MITIARSSDTDREVLFGNAADRAGIMNPAIVEKDFWVSFTLDYLFHKSPWPQSFIFKGGTSLSNGCKCRTGPQSTEYTALEAWKRRFKENDIEEDGYVTWRNCLDRYSREGISRFNGTDRPDTGGSDGE